MNKRKNKIRVLHAIRQGLIGGGETHVLGLVAHLDRSQFDPVVLSFTGGPMIGRLQEIGVPCYVIPSTRAFDLTNWGKVKSLLQHEEIDLIHVHGTRAASNLLWAAKSCHIPIIYTIHGWSFHDDQPWLIRKIRIMSEHYLTRKMDLNISVSASNQLSGKNNFPGFKSVIVNNGIDLEKFNPDNNYHDIRKPLNIPEESLLISFIARMTRQKAPLIMLKAFAKVVRQCPDAWLLMVGEGELRQKAEDLAYNLGVSHRVTFENFRQDIPAVLHASDIYCLPSLWEGLPIGLLEAMAMRNAVVATYVDGSKEIVQNEGNGLLVQTGSANALATALTRLSKDSDVLLPLQRKARKSMIDHFSVQTMVARISSLYLQTMRLNEKGISESVRYNSLNII